MDKKRLTTPPQLPPLPPWLPASVAAAAHAISNMTLDDHEGRIAWPFRVPSRILRDERMRPVWKRLLLRAPNADVIEAYSVLFSSRPDRRFDPSPYSSHERAIAFYLWHIVLGLNSEMKFVTRGELDEKAKILRRAWELCRDPIMNIGISGDPKVVDYLDRAARQIEQRRDSLSISRSTHNDSARLFVCDLAKITRQIFGSNLYGALAVIASVALGIEIDEKMIKRWLSADSRAKEAFEASKTYRRAQGGAL